MSLAALPSELLDKVLFHSSMRDRMNLRMACRELEHKIASTRYHHFKRVRCDEDSNAPGAAKYQYEYDDIELTCVHKNPKRFSISFGPHVKIVNVHSRKREQLASIRWRLFNSFRVDRVVLKVVNFNTVPVSFIEDFLGNCAFRSMVIIVAEADWHRSLLPFLHKYSCEIEELLVCNSLLPKLVNLPPLKLLAATPKSFLDERALRSLIGLQAGSASSDGILLSLVEVGHKKLCTYQLCQDENTLLHAFLTIADSPTYQEVEFDIDWDVVQQFFRLIGWNFEMEKKRVLDDPVFPMEDFKVRNCQFTEHDKKEALVSVKHRNAVMAFDKDRRARIFSLLEERTWNESMRVRSQNKRTRCQEQLECFSANCARIHELQRCIEQAAAYVAMVMVACTEPSCPKTETEAIDKFFVSPVIFKMNYQNYY